MLEIIKAIIYGIVEGITEWLPISSTGHLILVERLIPFKQTSEGFFDMFDVVIQLGAILAVVVLFWNKIWPFYLKKNNKNISLLEIVFFASVNARIQDRIKLYIEDLQKFTEEDL